MKKISIVSLLSVYSLKQFQRNLPLYLYVVKEKINPHEFPKILMILSKLKEQETLVAAKSSFKITQEMHNNTSSCSWSYFFNLR